MELNGLSILMFIFGLCVLLVGLYMFAGHKLGIMDYRPAFKNLSKKEWINIGKWTMISSVLIILIGIIAMFLDI